MMVRLEIKKAGINGEGIGFYQRKPVFVEGCFPDEIVECQLHDEGRHYRGDLKRIIRKSGCRVKPACQLCRICGACKLMSVSYEEQLKIKKQLLQDALYKYCGYDGEIEGSIASPQKLNYRNKCNLPIISHDGVLINALYRQGSNRPVLIDKCLIHEEGVEELRKEILSVFNKHHLSAYKHKEKKGLRQLIVRGFDDEYQATIITGNDILSEEVLNDLKQIRKLSSFYQGINTIKNPVQLMSDNPKLLFGKPFITMKGDYTLNLSPQAFFQLNSQQAERIYRDVNKLFTDRKKLIVEAYCGIGAISLHLHDKAEELIGIEIIEKAIDDAKANARINGFGNLNFIADDAARALRRISRKQKIDALVVDPPRTGLDDELIETIIRSKIKEVVYISCNPATLGKDLQKLKEHYQINLVRAYDMFPQTPHIETVCLLTHS